VDVFKFILLFKKYFHCAVIRMIKLHVRLLSVWRIYYEDCLFSI